MSKNMKIEKLCTLWWIVGKPKGQIRKKHTKVYHYMIDANFKGTDEARVFVVDGKAAGIMPANIPNSKHIMVRSVFTIFQLIALAQCFIWKI